MGEINDNYFWRDVRTSSLPAPAPPLHFNVENWRLGRALDLVLDRSMSNIEMGGPGAVPF